MFTSKSYASVKKLCMDNILASVTNIMSAIEFSIYQTFTLSLGFSSQEICTAWITSADKTYNFPTTAIFVS